MGGVRGVYSHNCNKLNKTNMENMESLARLEIHIPLSNLLEVTFSVSILFELHIEHDAI